MGHTKTPRWRTQAPTQTGKIDSHVDASLSQITLVNSSIVAATMFMTPSATAKATTV